jgi:hypothetical protein
LPIYTFIPSPDISVNSGPKGIRKAQPLLPLAAKDFHFVLFEISLPKMPRKYLPLNGRTNIGFLHLFLRSKRHTKIVLP